MKRLNIYLSGLLLVGLCACTEKKEEPKQTGKTPGAAVPAATSPAVQPNAPKLPGTFALDRAVRNQLSEQKKQAKDRAEQFDAVLPGK